MDASNPLWHTFSALLGAIVGGGISFLLNREQIKGQLEVMRAQHKTEFVAEETARMLLSHQSFTDRSFEALRRALGGFEDDELRKILVRAGATRVYREDGSEWWRLVSRMDEFIERKDLERMAEAVIPATPPATAATPPVIPAKAGIQGPRERGN